MGDLQLPKGVRPLWIEAVFTSEFERDTLPLLFAGDRIFEEYYDALIHKNRHVAVALEQIRERNSLARLQRASGEWQECVESLLHCVHLRRCVFEESDYQFTAAQKHCILSLLNLATFFLREGDVHGRGAKTDALLTRAFELFKRAEEMVTEVQKRTDRLFLRAATENNFAAYFVRRKKHKAAAQRGVLAQRAWGSLSIRRFDLYFAVQRGGGDLWSNRFEEGLRHLKEAMAHAPKEDDARATNADPSPAEQRKGSDEESARSTTPSANGTRGGQQQQQQQPDAQDYLEEAPVRFTISVLGCSIDIVSMSNIALHHNVAVALIGLRRYREAVPWITRAMELAVAHQPTLSHRPDVVRTIQAAQQLCDSVAFRSKFVDYRMKQREFVSDAFRHMQVSLTKSSGSVAYEERRKELTRQSSALAAGKSKERDEGDHETDDQQAQRQGESGSAAASRPGTSPARARRQQPGTRPSSSATQPQRVPHRPPTTAEALRTYLKGLSYRQLVEEYGIDDTRPIGQKKQQRSSSSQKSSRPPTAPAKGTPRASANDSNETQTPVKERNDAAEPNDGEENAHREEEQQQQPQREETPAPAAANDDDPEPDVNETPAAERKGSEAGDAEESLEDGKAPAGEDADGEPNPDQTMDANDSKTGDKPSTDTPKESEPHKDNTDGDESFEAESTEAEDQKDERPPTSPAPAGPTEVAESNSPKAKQDEDFEADSDAASAKPEEEETKQLKDDTRNEDKDDGEDETSLASPTMSPVDSPRTAENPPPAADEGSEGKTPSKAPEEPQQDATPKEEDDGSIGSPPVSAEASPRRSDDAKVDQQPIATGESGGGDQLETSRGSATKESAESPRASSSSGEPSPRHTEDTPREDSSSHHSRSATPKLAEADDDESVRSPPVSSVEPSPRNTSTPPPAKSNGSAAANDASSPDFTPLPTPRDAQQGDSAHDTDAPSPPDAKPAQDQTEETTTSPQRTGYGDDDFEEDNEESRQPATTQAKPDDDDAPSGTSERVDGAASGREPANSKPEEAATPLADTAAGYDDDDFDDPSSKEEPRPTTERQQAATTQGGGMQPPPDDTDTEDADDDFESESGGEE